MELLNAERVVEADVEVAQVECVAGGVGGGAEFARLYRESVHLCVPDWDSALLLLDIPDGGLVRLSL